jgi:hypothetical protein
VTFWFRFLRFSGFVVAAAMMAYLARAADLSLSTAGAHFAPLDVKTQKDPEVPLSRSKRKELLVEFRGLVSMGAKNYNYDGWSGRDMSDCVSDPGEVWRYRCEIIMGQSNAYYYFYANGSGSAHLKRIDVRLQTTDTTMLQDVRPSLQGLLGRGESLAGSPPGRRWKNDSEEAQLYYDERTGGGVTRFTWRRS